MADVHARRLPAAHGTPIACTDVRRAGAAAAAARGTDLRSPARPQHRRARASYPGVTTHRRRAPDRHRSRARLRPRGGAGTVPAPPGGAPVRHRPRPGPRLGRGHRLPRGGRDDEGRGPHPGGGRAGLLDRARRRRAEPVRRAAVLRDRGLGRAERGPAARRRADPQAADPHRGADGRVDRRLPALGPGAGRPHRTPPGTWRGTRSSAPYGRPSISGTCTRTSR